MKVLLGKPGLDGHDVGVKVLAHGLIEVGFEIIYSGLRKSIEQIIDLAVQHNVDIIGLSILSGTHLILAKKMQEVMNARNLQIPWFVGGNIPVDDVDKLIAIGAKKAFPTGSKVQDVIAYFETLRNKGN